MRVAYVLYNERPASGLIRTQVISLLMEIKRIDPSAELNLLAFWQPWVAWKFRGEIKKMRMKLAAAGIQQLDYPYAVIPSRYFLYKVFLFPLLHLWVKLIFVWALRVRYDVVHSRGYLPSLVTVELKSKYGHSTVFDMRSLWPKEHVTIGAWSAEDGIHRMWERIEKFTLEQSDASIGVSAPMVDEMRAITSDANAVHIPICVDPEEFCFDPASRLKLRKDLGWDQQIVIAYQGSLGLLNSNLAEVAEYFSRILDFEPATRFLILTQNTAIDIPAVLRQHGIKPESYAVRCPRRGELAGWLSAADAGIHAMSPGPDSATRLGVKVVEYLSCGLPIIVNSFVGAAADLVREHEVGVVLDLDCGDEAKIQLAGLFSEMTVPVKRSRKLALDLFSVHSCAKQYVSLYRAITNQCG